MYQKNKSENGNIIVIERDGRRLSFPEDPANTDYQQYLKYIEDGGEVEIVNG